MDKLTPRTADVLRAWLNQKPCPVYRVYVTRFNRGEVGRDLLAEWIRQAGGEVEPMGAKWPDDVLIKLGFGVKFRAYDQDGNDLPYDTPCKIEFK